MSEKSPTVFISYSHDSEAHRGQVRALVDRLVADGVDCVLDQYVQSPPQGWPAWMEQQVASADWVVVVQSAGYLQKASGTPRPVTGRGVRLESVLLIQDLYDAGMWNERFVPVLLDDATEQDIIRPLRPYDYYRPDTDEGYVALYRRLTDQPSIVRPPLGPLKKLPPEPSASTAGSPSEKPTAVTPERSPARGAGSAAPRKRKPRPASRTDRRWPSEQLGLLAGFGALAASAIGVSFFSTKVSIFLALAYSMIYFSNLLLVAEAQAATQEKAPTLTRRLGVPLYLSFSTLVFFALCSGVIWASVTILGPIIEGCSWVFIPIIIIGFWSIPLAGSLCVSFNEYVTGFEFAASGESALWVYGFLNIAGPIIAAFLA